MGSRMHKRKALRRKTQVPRPLSSPKSAEKSAIFNVMNMFHSIYKLTLKLEAIKRECSNLIAIKSQYLDLINHVHVPKEVKVEKFGKAFVVKARCQKGESTLVSILEAFEEMGLNVMHARVHSSDDIFAMEAIVVAPDHLGLPVSDVTQAVSLAIERKKLN